MTPGDRVEVFGGDAWIEATYVDEFGGFVYVYIPTVGCVAVLPENVRVAMASPRTTCPCCAHDRSIAAAFSPCVVCSTFVCDVCRGDAVRSGRIDGDAAAYVCHSCRRNAARDRVDYTIAWDEHGRPRLV